MSISCAEVTTGGSIGASCSWTASTSSSFGYYQLLRWTGSGGEPANVYTTTGKTTTSRTDGPLAHGQTYSYVIVAYSANGSIVGYSKRFALTA
jgi:hypothetical protein